MIDTTDKNNALDEILSECTSLKQLTDATE